MKLFPVLSLALFTSGFLQAETSVLQPNDRIVFVGDSITGQGAGTTGWAGLIGEALKATHPDGNFTIISLGGSGQGVGSWQNIEKKSRAESVILDVKTLDVKTELGQPANVVISMLGMNDILFPRMRMTPEDYAKWGASYLELINAIKERTKPRVVALATPTMCTEDPAAPKNVAMRELHNQITTLAKSEGFTVLPTYETMQSLLNEGRGYTPDFHVTGDSVHPNAAGHLAIAIGMLKGLGETSAAQYLYDKYSPKLWNKDSATLSWTVENLPGSPDAESQQYRIHYFSHVVGEKVTLDLPEGWKIVSGQVGEPTGEVVVEGIPNRLVNPLILKAGSQQTKIPLPAPWLIGTGNEGGGNWVQNTTYDPEKAKHEVDEALSKGDGFGTPIELKPGKPLVWKRHFASPDLAGGISPGAIDMAGVTFYQTFDVGYGARWIQSPTARPLTLRVRSMGFANGSYLTIWLNGEKVFGNHIKTAKDVGDVTIQLKAGWNALVFKSNHLQTQWQFAIDLEGDNLNELTLSTHPPK